MSHGLFKILPTAYSLTSHIFDKSINRVWPVVYWLSSQEMDTATRVQILDETDCISRSTNALGKGIESNFSPSSYG